LNAPGQWHLHDDMRHIGARLIGQPAATIAQACTATAIVLRGSLGGSVNPLSRALAAMAVPVPVSPYTEVMPVRAVRGALCRRWACKR